MWKFIDTENNLMLYITTGARINLNTKNFIDFRNTRENTYCVFFVKT